MGLAVAGGVSAILLVIRLCGGSCPLWGGLLSLLCLGCTASLTSVV